MPHNPPTPDPLECETFEDVYDIGKKGFKCPVIDLKPYLAPVQTDERGTRNLREHLMITVRDGDFSWTYTLAWNEHAGIYAEMTGELTEVPGYTRTGWHLAPTASSFRVIHDIFQSWRHIDVAVIDILMIVSDNRPYLVLNRKEMGLYRGARTRTVVAIVSRETGYRAGIVNQDLEDAIHLITGERRRRIPEDIPVQGECYYPLFYRYNDLEKAIRKTSGGWGRTGPRVFKDLFEYKRPVINAGQDAGNNPVVDIVPIGFEDGEGLIVRYVSIAGGRPDRQVVSLLRLSPQGPTAENFETFDDLIRAYPLVALQVRDFFSRTPCTYFGPAVRVRGEGE